METKTCSRCKYTGPVSDFHEPKHRHLCKDCRREDKREQRKRAVARTKATPSRKACSQCGTEHPISHFLKRAEAPDGHDGRCKDCTNGVRRAYWVKTRARRNQLQRDRKYGLAPGEYAAMKARQCGLCAICRKAPERPLVVDHCHKSGRVRNLLCDACNKGLGFFQDSPELLIMASRYAEVHCAE